MNTTFTVRPNNMHDSFGVTSIAWLVVKSEFRDNGSLMFETTVAYLPTKRLANMTAKFYRNDLVVAAQWRKDNPQ